LRAIISPIEPRIDPRDKNWLDGVKEKASGAKTDRPELAKAIRRLEAGDVLVVTRLDRLARSTRDLLNILDELGKRGVGFRSVKDAWADTTTPHGRLMLTVLGGLAEFERELIRARTDDGRKRAQARGVRFGRPSVDGPPASGSCPATRGRRCAG
jgi:DNA invertase Pin-like site-specific DNA recombinase